VGAGVVTRGTSKSAVSRRFVARTRAQIEAWQTRPLAGLDVVALLVDGVRFAADYLVVAMGIEADGRKQVLGLWEGSTENAVTCQALLTNLTERGLRTDRSLVVVLDGSKAIRKAVDQTFGVAACVQRCQVHKVRNVLGHLPLSRQAGARATLREAYRSPDAAQARRRLESLARQLDAAYPTAAASMREGLEETLTVLTLPVSATLRRGLATTNTIENLIGRVRHVHRQVKRWRGRRMALRWGVAGVIEAAKTFQRFNGYADMRALINALRARDKHVGLDAAVTAA
jgi:transposase-like protein